MDSNHRNRTIADLQSAPFDRSGTYPFVDLQTVDTVCGDNLHKSVPDCKTFFVNLLIFLFSEVSDGDGQEYKPNTSNEKREPLSLCYAVPYAGIGFFVAFADDAGGCVKEGKQGREYAGGCAFPQQTHTYQRKEDEQTFAEGFKQLRRVTRGKELPEGFADGIVLPAEAAQGIEEGFTGQGE